MKCLRCGTDSLFRSRTNGRCPDCGEWFAFEPRRGDRITDARFHKALYAVSEWGTVRWSLDHLYYEVCRRATDSRSLLRLLPTRRRLVPFDRRKFDQLCLKWYRAHGKLGPARMEGDEQLEEVLGPYLRDLEADIATYTFDRAIVCDRSSAVDLLLANDFHVENRCAVLSIDGHPRHAFSTVLEMLKQSPRLLVIAVHDASSSGCQLPRQLAGSEGWFRSEILAGRVRLVDAGLRPDQVRKLKRCYLRNRDAVAPGAHSPADAKFLSRFSVELAAMRPGNTLRHLRRLLAGPPPGSGGDRDDGWVDGWGDGVDEDGTGADDFG